MGASRILSRTVVGAVALGLAVTGLVATAGSASADSYETKSTNCSWTDGSAGLELYYNSNEGGAAAFMCSDVYDYAGYVYSPNGAVADHVTYVFSSKYAGSAGNGVALKNNAASAEAQWGAFSGNIPGYYMVYYNSGYAGHSQYFGALDNGGAPANLDSTLKNNEASQRAFA
ncbi:hypothetical protein [Streptacidiphilus cavernicola]|uniref:Peptidase inhibitor family I36 n=1 Tax=Streptacidiphilus cavernicola TaxID=3342716 RepID=A0ABV6VZA9_9ACTN